MCGIFAYSGLYSQDLVGILLEGLSRLDYRGHDSSGIAFADNGGFNVLKEVGEIDNIKKVIGSRKYSGSCGIAHTRWATHGKVSRENAHPHLASDGSFALVHNGIVENFEILKIKLKNSGYRFISETDTEVIVGLIETELKKSEDFPTAIRKATGEIKGRNTFALITKDGDIYGFKNGSPLVLGIGKKKNLYLSSDTLSFSHMTKKAVVIDNGETVHIRNGDYFLQNQSGIAVKRKEKILDIKSANLGKEGYPHFMLKEIYEAPTAIKRILDSDKSRLFSFVRTLKKAGNIYALGSGTAGIAASQVAYYLRVIAGINATSLVGAEAGSYLKLLSGRDVLITLSQSGETADVLEVLEAAKKKGVKIASLVNMQGSSIERISDYYFPANSGPEVCVLSTKVFVAQISWGYLLAKTLAGRYKEAVSNLNRMSDEIKKFLQIKNNLNLLKSWAGELVNSKDIFILGKSQNLAISMEGMVKIVEGTYKHAHAIPAGDLKHYAITIIEKGIPVILLISKDENFYDLMNAAQEVKARGAEVYAIGQKEDSSFSHFLKTPNVREVSEIGNVIPLQLLAYFLGIALGNNIDKPRNIAKSVTVK